MRLCVVIIAVSIFWSQTTLALCMRVPVKTKEISVVSCETLIPSTHPRIGPYIEGIRDLDQRRLFELSYTGAIITATDKTYFMLDIRLSACSELNQGDTIQVKVSTACCDGDPNFPCLLGISEHISEIENQI